MKDILHFIILIYFIISVLFTALDAPTSNGCGFGASQSRFDRTEAIVEEV